MGSRSELPKFQISCGQSGSDITFMLETTSAMLRSGRLDHRVYAMPELWGEKEQSHIYAYI